MAELLWSPADTIKGAHKTLLEVMGADGAAEAICKNVVVLRSFADTVKSASDALCA